MSWSRRELLTAAATLAAAGPLPRFSRAQSNPEPLALTELGEALFLLTGAGANIVIEAGGDGLVLVDDGLAERAGDLARLLAEHWPGRPVELVFNTNWRPEHTGANAALAAAGARILAHENTKLWLAGDFFVEWENRRYHPQPPGALPTQTFYESGSVEVPGGAIDYRYLPRAHTDGDICVSLPQRNVLVVSDLLAVGRYPVPDYVTGGWIGGFEDATRALLEIADADTRIVPAVGGVCGRMDLEAQLELCTTVRERVAEAFRHGMSFEDFAATAPTREFDAERGDPSRFLELVYEGAWAHVRELRGVI